MLTRRFKDKAIIDDRTMGADGSVLLLHSLSQTSSSTHTGVWSLGFSLPRGVRST